MNWHGGIAERAQSFALSLTVRGFPKVEAAATKVAQLRHHGSKSIGSSARSLKERNRGVMSAGGNLPALVRHRKGTPE